jgi:hypothetical protein
MCGDLGPCVAGAYHDERTALGPLGGIRRLRELDLPDYVVTQIEGLSDAAKTEGALGDSRDRKQLVHTPDSKDKTVIAESVVCSLRVRVGDLTTFDVDRVHRSEQELDARAGRSQRHRHPARFQDSTRDLRK